MKTSITTITLFTLMLMYLGFGVALFFYPSLLSNAEIYLSHPTAVMEARAFYGGLEIGLGIFFACSLFQKERRIQAVQLGALLLSFTLIGRVYGGFVDGVKGNYLWIAILVETPIWILSLLSLFAIEENRIAAQEGD